MIQLPQPLNVFVPPMLGQLIGYEGEARYFGLYWMPAGDEAMVCDGRMGGDCNWHGYQAFVDHPAVRLPLADYRDKLGSSDEQATHWLIVDRVERKLFVLPVAEADQFLAGQHPPLPKIELTTEELDQLLKNIPARLADRPIPSREAIEATMQAEYRLEREMAAWLDANMPAETRQQWADVQSLFNRIDEETDEHDCITETHD